MSSLEVLTVASAGFEAACQIDVLPAGHPGRALHGHSFRVSVFAGRSESLSKGPAGAVQTLQDRLQDAVAELDYTHLNQVIASPTDENIARWVRRQLNLPGIERVAVRSTEARGVDLGLNDQVQAWRRYRFEAAHRLPHVPLGHKCGRMHGHGFEVVLHARQHAGGEVSSAIYDRLDAFWTPLRDQLHRHCLNDIDGLENPTSENLSAWIWARLKSDLSELTGVTVFETASCGANFDGAAYRIWKEFSLDGAVREGPLRPGTVGPRTYGHTYTLRLHLCATLDRLRGWTVDFGDVKAIFDPLFKAIDHHPLYELPGLADGDVANVAQWIFAQAQPRLPSLYRIDLYETPRNGCLVTTSMGETAPPFPV